MKTMTKQPIKVYPAKLPYRKWQGGSVGEPTSAPRASTENSTPIIEPETAAKNSEVAGQPLEQPKCKTCDDTKKTTKPDPDILPVNWAVIPCPDCIEQPNQNAMIVKTIQGLMSVINHNLEKLNTNTRMLSCHRNSLVLQALEDIDIFERTTLFELQKAFE